MELFYVSLVIVYIYDVLLSCDA